MCKYISYKKITVITYLRPNLRQSPCFRRQLVDTQVDVQIKPRCGNHDQRRWSKNSFNYHADQSGRYLHGGNTFWTETTGWECQLGEKSDSCQDYPGYFRERIETQQIGVHEAPLCVLLALEIWCSSTKLTFVLTLSAWCVFHVFGCDLSLYRLSSHCIRVCLLLGLRSYRAHGELEIVLNQRIVNTKNPEHTLAPICWEVNAAPAIPMVTSTSAISTSTSLPNTMIPEQNR